MRLAPKSLPLETDSLFNSMTVLTQGETHHKKGLIANVKGSGVQKGLGLNPGCVALSNLLNPSEPRCQSIKQELPCKIVKKTE